MQGVNEHRGTMAEDAEAPTNEEFDAAVQIAVDKALHEQLRGMVEEVQEVRNEREVTRQEMVAMREEITRLQRAQSQPPRARTTTTTPATATRKTTTTTRNTAPSTSTRGNSQRATGRGASNHFPNDVHDALSGNNNNYSNCIGRFVS